MAEDKQFFKVFGQFVHDFLEIVDNDEETNEQMRTHLTTLLVRHILPLLNNSEHGESTHSKIGLKKNTSGSSGTSKATKPTKSVKDVASKRGLTGYGLYSKVARYANTHGEGKPMKLGIADYAAQWRSLSQEQQDQFGSVAKTYPVVTSDDLTEIPEDDLNALLDHVNLFKKEGNARDYSMFTKVRAIMKSHNIETSLVWSKMTEAEREDFFNSNSQYWDEWLSQNPDN